MQANNQYVTTPSNTLINDLLVSGIHIQQPELSSHGRKLLGGRYLSQKGIFENDTASWITLLKLATELGVKSTLIKKMFCSEAKPFDSDRLCNALLDTIRAEMEKFKTKLAAIYPLSTESLRMVDAFGGELTVTNRISELNNRPFLVLYLDWLVPVDVRVKTIKNDKLRLAACSLLESLSRVGYFLHSSELIYDHYLNSMFFEMFSYKQHPTLMKMDVDALSQEDAIRFIEGAIPKHDIDEFLSYCGFDSLDEIDTVMCLALSKELVESQKTDNKIGTAKSLIKKLTQKDSVTLALKALLPLINKVKTESITAFDRRIEGTHSFCFMRTVLNGGPSSCIIDESGQYLMESGESAVLAVNTTSKKELLTSLQQYYLVNYIIIALSEIFD